MSSNYFYDKLPGARLEVGPHGRLMETLGHTSTSKPCCSGCASGKSSCGGGKTGLGALLIPAEVSTNPATVAPLPGVADSGLPTWAVPVAAAGVAIVGVLWFLRRRRAA